MPNQKDSYLTGNNVLISVLLDVVWFFCCFGGVGLVSAVLRGLAFQPLKTRKTFYHKAHFLKRLVSLCLFFFTNSIVKRVLCSFTKLTCHIKEENCFP